MMNPMPGQCSLWLRSPEMLSVQNAKMRQLPLRTSQSTPTDLLAHFSYAEQGAHLFMEEALSGFVRLNPRSIQHKLWNGALANVFYQIHRCRRRRFNIDFGIGNPVFLEKALSHSTIATPRCCIDH